MTASGEGTVAGLDAIGPRDSDELRSLGLREIAVRRGIGLVASSIATLLSAALVIRDVGAPAYGVVSLLSSAASLFAFTDLGLGASVIGAAARAESDPDRWVATARGAIRATCGSAVAVVLAAVALLWSGAWAAALGAATQSVPHVPAAATLILLLVAIGIPLGLGQRTLLGLGLQSTAVTYQGLTGPVALILIALVDWSGAPTFAYALCGPAAAVVVGCASTWVAQTHLHRAGLPTFREAMRLGRGLRTFGVVAGVAIPMLALSITQPIALYGDRLVLSHVSDARSLASYAVAGQLSFPVLAVVGALGDSLWPRFERVRAARADDAAALLRVIRLFAVVGLGLGGALIVVGPLIGREISDGQAGTGYGLFACFAGLIAVTAAHYPSGIYLSDARGLAVQAALNLLMLAANLALSIVLGRTMGAPGPVLASAVSFGLVYAVPVSVIARRRALSRSRATSAPA